MRQRFTHSQKLRWKTVNVAITVKIANASSTGVNWVGCSKSMVYEDFEMGRGHNYYTTDRIKFEDLMDKAAKIVDSHKRQLQENIGEMLHTFGKSA